MRWDDIRYFLAVARHRSIVRAAEQLGVNYTTVVRRLSALEEELDTRLFEKLSKGSIAMTAAAESVFEKAAAMEIGAVAFERSVAGRDVQLAGRLRLSTSSVVASYLILPHIARFARMYPDIELEISASDQLVDLSLREADIAVRAAFSSPPGHLIGTRLAKLGFGVYASKKYLRAHPDLDSPRTTVLRWMDGGLDAAWREAHLPNATPGPLFNDSAAMAAALRAGLGVGGLLRFIGDSERTLTRALDVRMGPPNVHLWLLHHPDLRTTARVRMFRDFLKETLLAHKELLEG